LWINSGRAGLGYTRFRIRIVMSTSVSYSVNPVVIRGPHVRSLRPHKSPQSYHILDLLIVTIDVLEFAAQT